MILGAVSCPNEYKRKILEDIRAIKIKHGLDSRFEIKWTKVSASKVDFYIEVLNYFWENSCLILIARISSNIFLLYSFGHETAPKIMTGESSYLK